MQVRMWLDDTGHDHNQGDDHGFSLLHWAAKEGQGAVLELLLGRGARVSPTNMGDDTPLHLAAAHGHGLLVATLLRHRAEVGAINEHGNTPLHYACFWGYESIAEDLICAGALVTIANKYGDVPFAKCQGGMAARLRQLAEDKGQRLDTVQEFRAHTLLGYKTRSRDAKLSRHKGINIDELALSTKLYEGPSGSLWKGRWQKNAVVAKILKLREVTPRICRDFNEEFPKLRIFSHPNVLAVVGCCNAPPRLVVISQHLTYGSLFRVLHEDQADIVLDTAQTLRWALDATKGMAFIHSLNPPPANLHLSSRHLMVDDDGTLKVNMADAKFSFQERGKVYHPQWFAPEALVKAACAINTRAADMWSFGVVLWEMVTREVPFAGLSAMEAGMKIATEGLRPPLPPGVSPHISKLITIAMNEAPGKRPAFDMLQPILTKMCEQQ